MVSLIIPAFVAGLLTFFAPCTFPLVPAYLAFIGRGHKQAIWSALMYVLGFSAIFILFGTAFALGGSILFMYRWLLARIGGGIIIFFGLFLLGISRWPGLRWLNFDYKLKIPTWLHPGNPFSAFLLGVTFALGWTPCIGPILGSILVLAARTATVGQGAALLAVFSLGLAIPFLVIALMIDSAKVIVKKFQPVVPIISTVGGVLLVLFGILLLTNHLELWNQQVYHWLSFIHYDALLNYL